MDITSSNSGSVIDEIKAIKDVLPQKQRQLCNYILMNYKTVGMASVAELARQANVGTTTVMRLIGALKYTTYSDFKKDLFSVIVLQDNSSYQNIKHAFTLNDGSKDENNLSRTGSEMISLIQNFLSPKNLDQYEKAVKLMSAAKKINILGQRSSKAAAYYMEYSLSPFLYDKIKHIGAESDYLLDSILHIKENEVAVFLSNWPCSRNTIEAAHFCHEKGVPIILITNSSANPIARFCDILLDTNSVSSSCLLAPAILIIEALTFELAQRTAPKSTQEVEELERMLKDKSLLIW